MWTKIVHINVYFFVHIFAELFVHIYADECYVHISVYKIVDILYTIVARVCSPSHVDMFLSVVTDCANAVADWMRSNRLQLNSDKTEFMWCGKVRRQHSLPTVVPLIGLSTVTLSSAACDLGAYIDSGLTMFSHVRQTVS